MERRITLFAGHYGSGKTNLAVNYALRLRRTVDPGARVTVADLDIVNPYFRTKDSAAALAAAGVDLVVSDYANTNVDFPALPKELYALAGGDGFVVMDVGGDERGALALGRYAADIRAGGDFDMLGVVNQSRPLTRTPADAVAVLREIESACGLPFTGLVNNTNLGQETTAETVLGSRGYADEVARLMGVPLRFTSCAAPLRQALEAAGAGPVFPLEIQKLYYHIAADMVY